MKKLLTPVLATAMLAGMPVLAEEGFNEEVVAAMKDGIVIEAPWAVSMKDDEIIVFMTIHNGGEETDTIKGITSEVASKAGIAKFDGGPLLNAEGVETLETPNGEATTLDQDGYHLVLTDLKEKVESGDTVAVVLEFEDTGEMRVDVSVAVMQ